MPSTKRNLVLAAALALVGASRWLGRARIADDYDSIGFVRGLVRFDLAKLEPHFPGYPVYVALGKAALCTGLGALDAAVAVSVVAAMATAWAVYRLGGFVALALYGAAWLPWLLGGAALSDGTATAFVALACAALTFEGALADALAGAAIALAVGTRASYFPFALSFARWCSFAPARRRAAMAAGFGAASLAWLAPFVALVGGRALLALGRTHLVGHFTTWGGSVVTQSNLPLRAFAFARALVYDGLFAHGLALGCALPLLLWGTRPRTTTGTGTGTGTRTGTTTRTTTALLFAGPYALWVLVAQNLIDQPRHLLPLVALGCAALGATLTRRAAGYALAAVAACASVPLAYRRATVEPAAAQAARYVAATYPGANEVAVFGTRSVRFFETLAPAAIVRPRGWLSEVDVDVERLDVLPPVLLITSELEVDPERARRLGDGPTFCRDARIDRAQPCLTLRRYRLRP